MASVKSDDSFKAGDGEASRQPPPQEVSSKLEDVDVWVKRAQELEKELAATKKKVKPGMMLAPEIKAAEDSATQEIGTTNWVGKLNQYRDAHPIPDGDIRFVETCDNDVHHPRFTSSVMINEALEEKFGNKVSFTNKRAAKQYAAKKAIDWLIQNNHMPSDGSIKFPKPKQVTPQRTGTSPPSEGNGSPGSAISYASQVPSLCHRLGINPPRYEFAQASPGSPFCDVYADFSGDPLIPDKVGEIQNAFGKKKAKEQCAKRVILFLKDLEARRLAQFEDGARTENIL